MDLAEITSEMWQRCDSLAYIISTPPSKDPVKQHEYYSIIGPQLSELVTKSHKVQNAAHCRLCFHFLNSTFVFN